MRTPYYELHITFLEKKEQELRVKLFVEVYGWKYSIIDGDPVLGEGVKMYATIHFPTSYGIKRVKDTLLWTSNRLQAAGFNVIRNKIECVVFDEVLNEKS